MGTESLAAFGNLAPTTLWIGHGEADDAQVEVRWGRGIRELIVDPTSLSPMPEVNRGACRIHIKRINVSRSSS